MKKNRFFLAILILCFVLSLPSLSYARSRSGGSVKGYFKSNGTYVAPHYRGPSISSGPTFKMPKTPSPKSNYSFDYKTSAPKSSNKVKLPKVDSTYSYDLDKELKKLKKEMSAFPQTKSQAKKDAFNIPSSTSKTYKSAFSDSFYKTSNNFLSKREKSGFSDKSLKVVDGDTFYWQGKRYRVQGIDTPEVGQPNSYEAKWRLRQLLTSGMIEVKEVATDKYGRTVAEVTVNGQNVAETMKNEGYKKPK